MPKHETVTKGDSNPGSLDCESGVLPLSYRAPNSEAGPIQKWAANNKEGGQ